MKKKKKDNSEYFIKNFKTNIATTLTLTNGDVQVIGTISITKKELTHYTDKGLYALWRHNMTTEEETIANDLRAKEESELIEEGYIRKTPLSRIADINYKKK